MRRTHRAVIGVLASAVTLAAAGPASAQFPAPDCMVSDGGRILTSTGAPATFGGSASTGREDLARGHQVYIDHDPVTGFRFRSLTVTAVVCDLDARRAEILGTGIVTTQLGVDQLVQYRIAVLGVRSTSQVPDTYRITLSNGYDSGEQPVVHGNILVRGT